MRTPTPSRLVLSVLRPYALLIAALLLAACDDGTSGLQQRLMEVEAQRDAQMAKVTELQGVIRKLESAAPAPEASPESQPATAAPAEDFDFAGMAASVKLLGSALEAEVRPRRLTTFPSTRFAVFKLEQADGTFTGIAIPFVSQGDGNWECGWSRAQILQALRQDTQTAAVNPPSATQPSPAPVSPPSSTPVMPPAAAPMAPSRPPPAVAQPSPPVRPPPTTDSSASQPTSQGGYNLKPGERLSKTKDLDGNDVDVIIGADGTPRFIFK